MGKPILLKTGCPVAEYIGRWDDNPMNWNILVVGGKEKKKWLLTIGDDLSSLMVSNLDSLSSGERKGTSLNLLNYDYEQFTVSNLKALKPYVFQVLQDDCVAV